MTRTSSVHLALLAAAALALAGCADPYATTPTPSPPRPADAETEHPAHDQADRQPDRADPDTLRTNNATSTADAQGVARAYARAAGNWSWKTYRAQHRQLRALAGGELARQLAATPPDDDVLRSLAAQQQTNRARILAVDAQPTRSGRQDVIVVLAETAGAQGTRDTLARHNVYRATLRRSDRGWKVTAWRLLP